jgi:hypothetical protein
MNTTLLAIVVCLGTLAGTAAAQRVNTITVTLPFAASVGGMTLPAGEYTIRDVADQGGASVLQISGRDGKGTLALAMEVIAPKNQQTPAEATVVLKPTVAGYEIQTIWLAGQDIGYEFFSSK